MCIDELVDCVDCESYRVCPGHIRGDPDDCYPTEATCTEGAPENGPCARMLDAIRDKIDGDHVWQTAVGRFSTREQLQYEQGDKDDIIPDSFRRFDFSSAPYWWLSGFDVSTVKPYQSELEVFNAVFI